MEIVIEFWITLLLPFLLVCVAYFECWGIYSSFHFAQDMFLSDLRALQPELCITAAYGNILPSKFLNIPTLGESNVLL